jgi:hypothetical protein
MNKSRKGNGKPENGTDKSRNAYGV